MQKKLVRANKRRIRYVDDDSTPVLRLVKTRLPSLVIGLLLGTTLSVFTSKFEHVIESDVRVAFFIPFLVYMADAIGTQTENVYTRDLRSGKADFFTYLSKEISVGLLIGSLLGLLAAGVILLWLGSVALSLTVGLSLMITVSLAPPIAVLVTHAMQVFHKDPAVETGPITTVIQDVVTVVIYGMIATAIML